LRAQVTMNQSSSANLVEIFSSIQGEGLLVGFRQIFIRFYGCNLSCKYCDTVSPVRPDFCLLETTPGKRDFINAANPVSIERVVNALREWHTKWPGIHHSISITGGEPLLNSALLSEWLPELRKYLPIYLETNGTLHSALSQVIQHIDIISMDIKLPSASGIEAQWDHHREFLKISSASNTFVKIVINASTEWPELEKACKLVAMQNPEIPLILQPETGNNMTVDIQPYQLLELQSLSSNYLSTVRVIPQTHKFIGQL